MNGPEPVPALPQRSFTDWFHILQETKKVKPGEENYVKAQRVRTHAMEQMAAAAEREQVADLVAAGDVNKIAALGMGASDAATFGLGDEAAGAVSAIGAMLPGGRSPGQAYRGARDEARGLLGAARADEPIAAFGGGILGSVIPGVGIAKTAGLMRAGLPFAVRAARGAISGGLAGAGYGAASAEGGIPERVEGAVTPGLLGLGIGAVAGAIPAKRVDLAATRRANLTTAEAEAARQPVVTALTGAKLTEAQTRTAWFQESIALKKEMEQIRHAAAVAESGTRKRVLEEQLRGLELRNQALEAQNPLKVEAMQLQNAQRASEAEAKAVLMSGRVERDPYITELARLRVEKMQRQLGTGVDEGMTSIERALRTKLRSMGMSPSAIEKAVESAAKLTPQIRPPAPVTEAAVGEFRPQGLLAPEPPPQGGLISPTALNRSQQGATRAQLDYRAVLGGGTVRERLGKFDGLIAQAKGNPEAQQIVEQIAKKEFPQIAFNWPAVWER